MPDLTGLSKEETEEVIEEMNRGLQKGIDNLDALRGVYKEVYGEDTTPDEITDYALEISKGNITLEKAVKDYRNYLQGKKDSEEKIMHSLDLPGFVEIKNGAEKWELDYYEIIDENGNRELVIKYKLEH